MKQYLTTLVLVFGIMSCASGPNQEAGSEVQLVKWSEIVQMAKDGEIRTFLDLHAPNMVAIDFNNDWHWFQPVSKDSLDWAISKSPTQIGIIIE